jgi:hypothetical protein
MYLSCICAELARADALAQCRPSKIEISRRIAATTRATSCRVRSDKMTRQIGVVRRSNRGLPLTLVNLSSGMLSAEEISWCLHACASSLRALHSIEEFVALPVRKTSGDMT